MLDAIRKRRSVRRYTDEEVTDEQVRALLEAAMAAPSGRNLLPWHFIVVRDSKLKETLANTHVYASMAASAALVIVVCSDPRVSPRHYVLDAAAATENILIQAAGMGLGALWVACYPDENPQNFVRGALSIPDELAVISIIPIGHPAQHPEPRTQYDPRRVHYDFFTTD